MNSEVSVGDGLGGHIIITEVNPFTLVDVDDDPDAACADVFVSSRDAHLPVVVEVNIDYEEDASLSPSDEDFRGFLQEEVEDAQAFAELNSSIHRELCAQNQPHNGMLCEISCGAVKSSRTSFGNDEDMEEDVGEPRSSGEDCIIPGSTIKLERRSMTPENDLSVSKPSGQGNGGYGTDGSENLQGSVKRERTSLDEGVGCSVQVNNRPRRSRKLAIPPPQDSVLGDGAGKSCEQGDCTYGTDESENVLQGSVKRERTILDEGDGCSVQVNNRPKRSRKLATPPPQDAVLGDGAGKSCEQGDCTYGTDDSENVHQGCVKRERPSLDEGVGCSVQVNNRPKRSRKLATPPPQDAVLGDGAGKSCEQGDCACTIDDSDVLQGPVKRERASPDEGKGRSMKVKNSSKRKLGRTPPPQNSIRGDGAGKSCEQVSGDAEVCERLVIDGNVGRSVGNSGHLQGAGCSETRPLHDGTSVVQDCGVRQKPCSGEREARECGFGARQTGCVVGSHEKGEAVASRNRRKSSNVRKHPLYAKLESSKAASVDSLLESKSLSVEKLLEDGHPTSKASKLLASQGAAGDMGTGVAVKRSSRVRKIPAKLRGEIISNVCWIKTEPTSPPVGSPTPADEESAPESTTGLEKRKDAEGAQFSEHQDGGKSSHLKVASSFSLADHSDLRDATPPVKRKMQRKTDPPISSDSDDSDYVPDSTERESWKGKRSRSDRRMAESRLSLLAEYTAPDGENTSSDVGFLRNKAWSCKLCSYKSSSEFCLKSHLRAHTRDSFKCRECSYFAVSKASLIIHIRKHTGEKPFKCTSCEYACTTKSALKTHVKNHIGYKPFHCSQCDHRCLTKSHLAVHMRSHTGVKPFSCSLCSYKTASSGHLNRHMCTHTGEKIYRCKACKFGSSRSDALQRHMRVHDGGKVHQCTECDFSADFALSLKRHMFEHAVDDFSCKCPYCDFTTALPATLRDHVRTHPAQERKPFVCILCHYSNVDLHHMRQHMLSHADEKRFKCTECSYSSITSQSIARHMESHSGRKRPYSCDACPKKYSDKYQLRYHKKKCKGSKGNKNKVAVDEEQKKYQCSKCDFAAQYYTQLNIHKIKTHSDDATFHCNECYYVTNSKAHLTMHMRKHSGETPYRCTVCDFGTTNTIVLKRHKTGHKELWPFACDECDQRFRLKIHLDYHQEKGCEAAPLPVKSTEQRELWPFACDECDQRFRLKIHLDYHQEKGCEAAPLPVKSTEQRVRGSPSESNQYVPVSPQTIFKRKSIVKKIVGRKTAKRKKFFESDTEDEDDFGLVPSGSDGGSWSSTGSLRAPNGLGSCDDGGKAPKLRRSTRYAPSVRRKDE